MGVSRWARILVVLTLLASPIGAGGDPPEFVLQWGSFGTGEGEFRGMHGVVVDAEGNVYVVDTGNDRIQKFTGDGVFLFQWGGSGSAPGLFLHPHGVGIGPLGNIYVSETRNNRVQKFTSDGVFLTTWGSRGNGDGQFRHNHGLAVDSDGNVFVADRDQNRVQKFTTDGIFVMAWGTTGTGDGQFTGTNGVAVDAEGNVFVGDSSPRIQKFTNDGVFITSWGSAGVGDGQFNFPRGLSTDAMGNLYVADRNLHRMQQFTGTGEFLTKWGSQGFGEGQFNLPYAVRAGGNGFVYVADSSNYRIQKFRVANDPPLCDTAEPTEGFLWPPNHKFAPVGIVGVSDPDDDEVTITVTGVTQDEPVNGLGVGNFGPDAVLQAGEALLRRERSGLGNGRVYSVGFVADDGKGASCTGVVSVCVPHDRRRPVGCVDDGQAYDSLSPSGVALVDKVRPPMLFVTGCPLPRQSVSLDALPNRRTSAQGSAGRHEQRRNSENCPRRSPATPRSKKTAPSQPRPR